MLKKTYSRSERIEEWAYADNGRHVAVITKRPDNSPYFLYINDQTVTMHKTIQESETALSEALRATIDNAA